MASSRLGYKRQTLERRKRELRQRTGQNLDDYVIYRNYFYWNGPIDSPGGKRILDAISYVGYDHDTLRQAIDAQPDELDLIHGDNPFLNNRPPDEIRIGVLPRSTKVYETKGTHRRVKRGLIRKGFS